MARIGPKGSKPELMVRSGLHRRGLRFTLHDASLPGSPDLVFRRFKVVVFVHGCFWHRHNCRLATHPSTNVAFWEDKFKRNVERDRRKSRALRKAGWTVLTVWQCQLMRDDARRTRLLDRLANQIRSVRAFD